MKNIILPIFASLLIGSATFSSCVDDVAIGDGFLEKAPGVDVTIDTVFSKAEYAKMFLWESYRGLYNGLSWKDQGNSCMYEAISDVVHSVLGWDYMDGWYYNGMLTEDGNDGWVRDKFAFNDATRGIWGTVRACWLFIQNVDRVPDMSENEKARLKAEARLIIASRYYDAFCNFGGLPLIDHAYETGEEFIGGYLSAIPGEGELVGGRATVEETVTFIDNLLQQVIDEPQIPFAVADYMAEGGRLTKGGAYGIRAKLYQFVASPIFNDDQPYRQYDAPPKIPVSVELEHDPLLSVWVGGKKPELWNKCVQACEAFFTANEQAGTPYALVQPAGSTEADYRRAYRSAYYSRQTTEKIIEVRGDGVYGSAEYQPEWDNGITNTSHYGSGAPTVEWFNMFPWADGRNFDGQKLYNTTNDENIDIFADRDPRLYECILVPHRNINNQFDTYQDKVIDCWIGGDIITGNWWFTSGYIAHGFGQFKWVLDYYDLNDERYSWPYLRMADMHLVYAEALAQTGRTTEAIAQVDKVRARVGLPSLTVNSTLNLNDKNVLIEEILRERACELAMENSRLMDLIRYKRQDIFCSPLHRMNIYAKDAISGEKTEIPYSQMNGIWPNFIYETEVITTQARVWWSGNWDNKWYMSPLTRSEINKGYGLFQNPGWE